MEESLRMNFSCSQYVDSIWVEWTKYSRWKRKPRAMEWLTSKAEIQFLFKCRFIFPQLTVGPSNKTVMYSPLPEVSQSGCKVFLKDIPAKPQIIQPNIESMIRFTRLSQNLCAGPSETRGLLFIQCHRGAIVEKRTNFTLNAKAGWYPQC